eukprot:6141898-Karenia_brevis.AAC.1
MLGLGVGVDVDAGFGVLMACNPGDPGEPALWACAAFAALLGVHPSWPCPSPQACPSIHQVGEA